MNKECRACTDLELSIDLSESFGGKVSDYTERFLRRYRKRIEKGDATKKAISYLKK